MSPFLLFFYQSQKNIAVVERQLRVLPSTKVCMIKVFSQDDENLLLRDNDKIEWPAGSTLDGLFYALYDEAGREVPLTAEIASQIMVCLAYRVWIIVLLLVCLLLSRHYHINMVPLHISKLLFSMEPLYPHTAEFISDFSSFTVFLHVLR